MKYDNGKPQIALIPSEALLEVAKVLTFGAQKYGPNDWRHDGDKTEWSRTYSSIQRHLNSFWSGEDIDPESGLNHLAHAATQLFILMTHQIDGNDNMDDRYRAYKDRTVTQRTLEDTTHPESNIEPERDISNYSIHSKQLEQIQKMLLNTMK